MTFRAYLWLMGLTTAFAWAGWLFVIFRIDPEEAGALGLGLFYITLFTALIGTIAVIGAAYRVLVLRRKDVVSREVRITFRHAVMVSLVGILGLALAALGWLRWWVLLGLVVAVGVIEYIFLLVQESRRD